MDSPKFLFRFLREVPERKPEFEQVTCFKPWKARAHEKTHGQCRVAESLASGSDPYDISKLKTLTKGDQPYEVTFGISV